MSEQNGAGPVPFDAEIKTRRGKQRPYAKPERLKGRGAFASDQVERLSLWGTEQGTDDWEWIEIKRVITFGDQQAMAGKVLDSMELPGENDDVEEFKKRTRLKLNFAEDAPFELATRIVDWNIQDDEGKPVDVSYEAILYLDPDYAREIQRVIGEYDKLSGNPTRGQRAGRGRKTTS